VGLLPDTKKSNLISRQLISVQPLIDLSPFPQSHHNSPSLGMSLACLKLKKKKKKFTGGPDGVTKGDHCHSQHSENDTPPPQLAIVLYSSEVLSPADANPCTTRTGDVDVFPGFPHSCSTPPMPIQLQSDSDEWGFPGP
jgi:hypothetical protein